MGQHAPPVIAHVAVLAVAGDLGGLGGLSEPVRLLGTGAAEQVRRLHVRVIGDPPIAAVVVLSAFLLWMTK